MERSELDNWHMQRALALAPRGQGLVEPNPMVGCIIARGAEIIGEGWHGRFGGPHAEIEALRIAGDRARGATMYVTLEPCCHRGKTPPCTEAITAAGIRRVVVALGDPFPQVDGGGIAALRAAGIEVEVGLLESQARKLNAPYLKLCSENRPWVIAKWAMTLDGKIASFSGDSRWISNEQSRSRVHQLRGRVDAVLVGSGTARIDNPLLTARPRGPRQAMRIVVDGQAAISPQSQLVKTARAWPMGVAIAEDAPPQRCAELVEAGCEILRCSGDDHHQRLLSLLDELGRRRMTNILVEGGSALLGNLLDLDQIDEVHAFVAPKLLGGRQGVTPIGGQGRQNLERAVSLEDIRLERLDSDVYIEGRVVHRRLSVVSSPG